MIDEPIVGTLLGFAFFVGMVYLVAQATRFDRKAFYSLVRVANESTTNKEL